MKVFISFEEALGFILSNMPTVGTEPLPLIRSTGKVLAEDLVSKVNSPSTDASLKDGYAIISEDIKNASNQNPVRLKVVGSMTAGNMANLSVSRGQAIQITTGAPVPRGATAVLSSEFSKSIDDGILCLNTAHEGRNILKKGTDIQQGETVAKKSQRLSPALIGLMASSGLENAPVFRAPSVAVIATGDEVVAPGKPLAEGKLYASNMVEICSWLSHYGISFYSEIVPDRKEKIGAAITRYLPNVDAFITSGGAWVSERDLIIKVLEGLQWQGIYHRVRMGPGKGTGFGLLEKRPFFCLPGGPPSNEIAFLQLALPGLLAMKGDRHAPFPLIRARLTETVRGDRDWTQFIHARLIQKGDQLLVAPARLKSRIQSMAKKDALIMIPEGTEELAAGEMIHIQLLSPQPDFTPNKNS